MAEIELTDKQAAYVEYLLDPNRGTQREWAEANDVTEVTLRKWRKYQWFQHALERRMQELNVTPDRLQAVIDAMWKAAASGDVQAAKVYLAYVHTLKPPKQIQETGAFEDMTDEDLDAYLLA